jgi:DNA-binding IscR family transcriptional regulator
VEKPEKLSIWDVVDAVEPFKRIHECPLDLSSHGTNLCPLHRRLDNAMAMVENSFRETTVAELLADKGSVTPLCEDKKVHTIKGAGKPKRGRNKRK